MGVPITVSPSQFVPVMAARRNQFIENSRKIDLQSRLELDSPHDASGTDVGHVNHSDGNL
jgi:hypothetical protein